VRAVDVVDPNATTELERLTKKLAELEVKVSQQQLSRPDSPQKEAGPRKEPETSRHRGGRGRGRGGRPRPLCYTCGKSGHLTRDCQPSRCWECQEPGHLRRDCPLLKDVVRGGWRGGLCRRKVTEDKPETLN